MLNRFETLCVAIAMVIPNFGGIFGGLVVSKNLDDWYSKLKFPRYCPPNWLFFPIWFSLYTSMGYASYLVWKDGDGFSGAARIPLFYYAVQVLVNWMYGVVFFEMRYYKFALFITRLLVLLAAITGVSFYNINVYAGYIFIPYVVWLMFCSMLHRSVLSMNNFDDISNQDIKEPKKHNS